MADSSLNESQSKISRARVGSRTVLTPGGALTGKDIDMLEQIKQELTGENRNEIILDMKSVTFIDSPLLEYLLKMHDELKSRRGYLKFINVNAICKDIFIATRLINSFLVFNDIHEAIKN